MERAGGNARRGEGCRFVTRASGGPGINALAVREEGACRVGAGFLILHVYVRRYVIVSEGIRSVTLAVCCWLLD